ncbi:MAG: hypothetical protein GY833_19200 [Aestuariibacter sp.]|nr:hypothetical protein [Aestuariibacter sp.]
MADTNRLIKPRDKFCESFPDLNFQETYNLHTSGEPVLIADPIYLADVYNSKDKVASFLRAHGVFIMDFGGDVSSPVWWQHPFVLLPISMHLSDKDLKPPEGITVLVDEVGTDSGSFVFLSLAKDLPIDVNVKVNKVLAENNGALLELPAGNWDVFYEQWDAPEQRLDSLYRNIVLRWEPMERSK